MSARFIFRIDEMEERSDAPPSFDKKGNWEPLAVKGWNVRKDTSHGATGLWWSCDGHGIQYLPNGPPQDAILHDVFSTFYGGGHGFWIMRGDGTSPPPTEAWHRLKFDHDDRDYSSELTNAGNEQTLRCQPASSPWPRMLLPDIYHGPITSVAGYGGLTGDLPILLTLIAFSMGPDRLRAALPSMMSQGRWQYHSEEHGRTDKRGVIVYVYTYPGESSRLKRYEKGVFGKYYN